MLFETVIRLMRTYSTCPKCGKTIMYNGFKSNEYKAQIKCTFGWKLEVKERE